MKIANLKYVGRDLHICRMIEIERRLNLDVIIIYASYIFTQYIEYFVNCVVEALYSKTYKSSKCKLAMRNAFFPIPFWIFYVAFTSCNDKDPADIQRELTIRLLTENTAKEWVIGGFYIDEVETPISKCDSFYVLTMKADFTWQDTYTTSPCYQTNEGKWELNDQSNVVTIRFIEWGSGKWVERKFEITELTESIFGYQYPIGNNMKRIRMLARNG